MSDLVEFLRARLDEDEQAARAAYAGPWHVEVLAPSVLTNGQTADVVAADQTRAGWAIAKDHEGFRACSISDAEHIARHDPARVLREAEAKRRIIDEHAPAKPEHVRRSERTCQTCTTAQTWDEQANEAICTTLRLLALPYAHHPDYREDWRA